MLQELYIIPALLFTFKLLITGLWLSLFPCEFLHGPLILLNGHLKFYSVNVASLEPFSHLAVQQESKSGAFQLHHPRDF